MQGEPTSLNSEAIGMHELFMSYVNAGFTREEALQIIMAFLVLNKGGK